MVITEIKIVSFRGISGQLTFRTGKSKEGRPPIILLHGDNGTGKSSIVDAFEFALQNRLHRRGLASSEVPYALSLGKTSGSIIVTFENGTVYERAIELNAKSGHIHSTPNRPHSDYTIAPFILRRSDILLFWDTPEHQRQTVFMDVAFASQSLAVPELFHSERLASIEAERTKLKDERRRNADMLAHAVGVSPAEIDFGHESFIQFAKKYVYGGMTQEQRNEARRKGVRVNPINKIAEGYVKRIQELEKPILNLNGQVKNLGKASGNPRLQAVKDLLKSAEAELTSAFKEISTAADLIDKVEIVTGEIGKVDLSILVVTSDGRRINPKRIFSEANRDLLALLIFLTIVYEAGERGQSKTLVLDDVFQSVDAGIRLRVAEYIFKKFTNWQLFITTHDRLWHQQLRILSQRNGRHLVDSTVLRWDANNGPVISGATIDFEERLVRALNEGDTVSICANGGLLLEMICQELTVNLSVSVTRRLGDQYTLGDMWPSLSKVLKRSELKPEAENIDRWSPLRNLVGAHYNAWAQNVSITEANGFGSAVLSLVRATKCKSCFGFIGLSQKWKGVRCVCGNLELSDYKL